MTSAVDDPGTCPGLRLGLLGGFHLSSSAGELPTEAAGAQRLLAFLALRNCAMTRTTVAGSLWPDTSDARAHASLRSALARLQGSARDAVETTFVDIGLRDGVAVDLHGARETAHRLLASEGPHEAADMDGLAIATLSSELLPDWYDDWVVAESEEWRQLRLHALEALAGYLAEEGRFSDALAAALAAIRAEPSRETAHAALIRVHLAEGNQSEALRAFEQYRSLLIADMGIEPTARISNLVSNLHPG